METLKTYRPKEGFEEEFKSLAEKKNNLSKIKEEAYAKAKAEIDANFSERENMITNLLLMISEEVVEESVEGVVNEAEVCQEPTKYSEPESTFEGQCPTPIPGN